MKIEERGLSIEELARQADVPVRTIRYYITEGLLPGPGSRGKNTVYSEEHLQRLLLIRRLTEQHVPLSEIRSRVAALPLQDVQSLLEQEGFTVAEQERAVKAQSPKDYVSSLLRNARSRRHAADSEGLRQGSSAPPAAPPPAQPALFAPRPSDANQTQGRYGSMPQPEVLLRFELAPGVYLSVRQEEYERQRDLIEELISIARRRGLRTE